MTSYEHATAAPQNRMRHPDVGSGGRFGTGIESVKSGGSRNPPGHFTFARACC